MYGNALATVGGVAAFTLPFTGGHPLPVFVAGSSLIFAGLALRALAPSRHKHDDTSEPR